jgi:shikimate kinase
MILFLIGPRGSGKSTVARLLAARLGWPSVDADEYLEGQAGCSVAELFASAGEAAFRDLESATLAEMCGRPGGQVVATGGGVVLRPQNRALLKQHGWAAWLTADAVTLRQRLAGDAATAARRPALQGTSAADEIEEVLRQRAALYRECADCVVITSDKSPAQVADEVLAAWERKGR